MLLTKKGSKIVEIKVRDVVIANFPKHDPPGHEQEGMRPAIIIGFADKPYPMVDLIPISSLFDERTGKRKEWVDDPLSDCLIFPKNTANLNKDSVVLLGQSRHLGRDRIVDYCGRLTLEEFAAVVKALRAKRKII